MPSKTRRRVLPKSPSIAVAQDGETPVVHLTGEFDLSTRPTLEQHLEALQDSQRRTVVLDLSATTFIDTTVINTLVGAYRDGLDLIIRGASGGPRHALEVLALGEIFVFDDQPTRRAVVAFVPARRIARRKHRRPRPHSASETPALEQLGD